jgi:CheY-like chemotaxis protein
VAQADAEGDPYQMVFTDWQMPGLNGTQTWQRMRRMPLRLIPVCVLVSGSSGCPANELETNDFADFIAKPVMPARLADCIARTWGLAQVAQVGGGQRVEVPHFIPGRRILLVEDNALNQEVATELLLDMGFEVDLAEDGVVAVAQATQQGYDLILMDLQMPRMDGLEATQRIRQLAAHAQTPIVAMTANAFAEDRAAAVAAGMNDHLAKPVDPDLLSHVLATWLPDAVSHTEAAGTHDRRQTMAPNQADQEDLLLQLHRVAGLNLAQGLRSFRGNAANLAKLLQRFAAEHSADIEQTRRHLDAGDTAAAQRTLHTLKGLAGTVGLTELQTLAAQAESCLRQNLPRAETEAALQRAQSVLGRTVAAVPGPLPAVTDSPGMGLPELRTCLVTLRELLAADDLDAAASYAALRGAMAQHFPAQHKTLGRAMDDFAFDEALQLLDGMLLDTSHWG